MLLLVVLRHCMEDHGKEGGGKGRDNCSFEALRVSSGLSEGPK